jgi:hypothetical protein
LENIHNPEEEDKNQMEYMGDGDGVPLYVHEFIGFVEHEE